MDIVIRNLPKDTEQRIKQYCKDNRAEIDVLVIDAVEKYITQKSGDYSSENYVKVLKLRLGASDDFRAYAETTRLDKYTHINDKIEKHCLKQGITHNEYLNSLILIDLATTPRERAKAAKIYIDKLINDLT